MAKKSTAIKKRGRPTKKKIILPITPPGQMEDRILKRKREQTEMRNVEYQFIPTEQLRGISELNSALSKFQRSGIACPHCKQSNVRLVQRPNLFRCMLCNRKFLV